MVAPLRRTVIKIDRAIVFGIAGDDAKQALVEAFLSFGRRIGASITAEGIEVEADLDALVALGVDYGQGYFLGRPSPDLTEVPATTAGAPGEEVDIDAAGSVLTDLLSRRSDPFRLRAS